MLYASTVYCTTVVLVDTVGTGTSSTRTAAAVGMHTKRLLGQKILTIVKLNIHLFLEPRSLPESDGHRDHGGIGGSKNKYFFLVVFQRLMP